jgi:hypothetical protein
MALWKASRLPLRAADDLHELFDLSALIGLVAGGNRSLHAMGNVVAQDLLFHASERGADGGNLRHDVDAIPIVIDHARDPAHLTLDSAQSLRAGRLDVFPHARYIPLQGIRFKSLEEPLMARASAVKTHLGCCAAASDDARAGGINASTR